MTYALLLGMVKQSSNRFEHGDTRILVALASEDGTVLDRFILVAPASKYRDDIQLSRAVEDHITNRFDREDH